MAISLIISVPLAVIPPDIAQRLLCLFIHVHLTDDNMSPKINRLIEEIVSANLPYFLYDDRMMTDLFKLEVEAEEIVGYWRMTDLWLMGK